MGVRISSDKCETRILSTLRKFVWDVIRQETKNNHAGLHDIKHCYRTLIYTPTAAASGHALGGIKMCHRQKFCHTGILGSFTVSGDKRLKQDKNEFMSTYYLHKVSTLYMTYNGYCQNYGPLQWTLFGGKC